MIKTVGEILASEARRAIDDLRHCITPIFDVNDKGEAELLGSAVLIEVAGASFLCTAKHVVDTNKTSTLYFDGVSGLEILQGDFYSTDEFDVAVLELTTTQLAALQNYPPLHVDNIASPAQASASKYVEFIGFPASKNRKIYRQNKIKGFIQSHGCMVIAPPAIKVRVSFNKKRNIDAKTGKRVTAPDLYGMSGGAMFGVAVSEASVEGNPQPRLIGITTDWGKSSNEVSGTGIACVLAIIRDGWQVKLPAHLDPINIKTTPVVMRSNTGGLPGL